MPQLSDPPLTGTPPATEPAAGPATVLVADSPFVVRVAGLPASALTGLCSAPLRAAVRAVLAADRWLAAEGQSLADALRPVIGAPPDPAFKPHLVGLRRSLFGGRLPRTAQWSAPVRAQVPADVAGRIERWILRYGDRDRRIADLDGTLADAAARTRRSLLDTVADGEFRHGLAQSSPTLSAELEKWAAHRDREPARRVLVRLARYVSRAAAKTSPNSTFTTIGAGLWTPGGLRPLALAALPPRRAVVELRGTVFAELAAALTAVAELRPAMLVRANPSLTRLGGRLTVLGRRPLEDIASVDAVPEVARCLAALGQGWQPLERLHARLAGGAPAAKVAAFVGRLIELGVVELHLPVDDQCGDKFGELARWLREGGDAAAWAGVADACARLSGLLATPAGLAGADGHRVRLGRIAAAVGDLRAKAGLADDPAQRSALTHEYTVFTRPVATAAAPAWQPALADLDRIRRWMAPHDSSLPLRLALGAYWDDRFGADTRVPFPSFYRSLLADLRRRREDPGLADLRALLTAGTPGTPAAWRLPVLGELARLRERSLEALLHARPEDDGVVRADPARLGGPAAALPGYVRPAGAVSWFVQSDGPRLVLNSAMGGHGRGRGRPLYLIARGNGGVLPADLEPYDRPGPPGTPADHRTAAVPADSSGDFAQTLNLRLPGGGLELDYPFTVHRSGRRPRVALRELTVERDPATGLLRLRAGEGVLVTPAHTGMLVDTGLPPAMQLLTRGLGANPSWLLRPDNLLHPQPGGAEVACAPRIEVGTVVLRRAVWTVPAALLPRRGRGEPDAALLLRLHRWLAAHGIPERCFLRTNTPAGAHWTDPARAKARKPLYLDFTSPWLVALFEKLTAGATEEVAFSEALPAVEDDGTCAAGGRGTLTDRGQARHVTELLVETRAVGR